MAKKKILVVGWGGTELFGCSLELLDWLSQYANPQILLPTDIFVEADMLFMGGGPDVAISMYKDKQPPGYYTGKSCIYRQHFIDERLKNYIGKMPIFGVCMSHQALNLYFSGSMDQNIYHEVDEKTKCHELYNLDGTIILDEYSTKKKVPKQFNSTHHQGFTLNQLGEGFTPLALSSEGYVERMENSQLKIYTTQYHPERMVDTWTHNIMTKYLTN